jgi:predicted O-methyltransferase YrrM
MTDGTSPAAGQKRSLPALRRLARQTKAYVRQASSATCGPLALLLWFPRWLRSQRRTSLDDGLPWITYEAQRALERIITPEMRVFEYGSGGSTLYFARRVAELVSVEHDPYWHAKLQALVGNRAELILAPSTDEAPGDYASTRERYLGESFRAYAEAIDRFPDGYFDLLLIDGRARPSCFRHGRPKVRAGGWIMLDNSDRVEYASVVSAARDAGWAEGRYAGPSGHTTRFTQTTIWRT